MLAAQLPARGRYLNALNTALLPWPRSDMESMPGFPLLVLLFKVLLCYITVIITLTVLC